MQERAQRWPSAWTMEMHGETGQARIVEVRNVSETGLLFDGAGFDVGDQVRLVAMQQVVRARVIRLSDHGGAIAFDRKLTPAQLHNLRQVRQSAPGW